ncbi:MAG: MEDS domain-containing protein [Anaerolineae bacterium]
MTDNKEFLTITEAADFLQVSETSLRRWTNSGKLRCYRVGGRRERRFLKEDLVAFVQAMGPEPAAVASPHPPQTHDYRERHICLFFRNPTEQWEILRPYVLSHLTTGAPVLYIQDGTPPERLTTWLQAEGLDTAALTAQGLLRVLPPTQAYLLTGRFEAQRMLAFMESAILANIAAGHNRIFITGEMTWSLGETPGAEQMMAYEALLNPLLEKYPHVTIICQYDLKRFNAASVVDALLTHPTAHLPSGVVSGFYGP